MRARYRLPPARWGFAELRLWAGLDYDRHRGESAGEPLPEPITRSSLTVAPEAEACLGERWVGLRLSYDRLPGRGEPARPR